MGIYDLKIKRMALSLVPVFMRRPVMTALVQAAVHGVAAAHADFMRWRVQTDEEIHHTGQVCSLRGLLNDMFDPGHRQIEVVDFTSSGDCILILRRRETGRWTRIPMRPKAKVVECRGFGGTAGYDFEIMVPERLRGTIDIARLTAVTDRYKLCSRRWTLGFYMTKENG